MDCDVLRFGYCHFCTSDFVAFVDDVGLKLKGMMIALLLI